MSEKSAYVRAPWNWDKGCTQTFQGNGLTFEELQAKCSRDYHLNGSLVWSLVRTSKRGNRVMYGEYIDGYDSGFGGKAYGYYVAAIVRPDGVVPQYTVVYDEWDY